MLKVSGQDQDTGGGGGGQAGGGEGGTRVVEEGGEAGIVSFSPHVAVMPVGRMVNGEVVDR